MLEFERFQSRHIGPDAAERDEMLEVVGAPSLDALNDEAIPSRIRLKKPLDLPDMQREHEFLRELRKVAPHTQVFRSFIFLSSYDTVTPCVIYSNVLDNPGCYTAYTPCQ